MTIMAKCDVCGKEVQPGTIIFCCCSFGAMSLGYCEDCFQNHLEPEWGLQYLYYDVGDHGKELIDDQFLPGTIKDGKKYTWREYADWLATQPDPPSELDAL